jgi:hypothetical protein
MSVLTYQQVQYLSASAEAQEESNARYFGRRLLWSALSIFRNWHSAEIYSNKLDARKLPVIVDRPLFIQTVHPLKKLVYPANSEQHEKQDNA